MRYTLCFTREVHAVAGGAQEDDCIPGESLWVLEVSGVQGVRRLMQFVTGTTVFMHSGIRVVFNASSGLGRKGFGSGAYLPQNSEVSWTYAGNLAMCSLAVKQQAGK